MEWAVGRLQHAGLDLIERHLGVHAVHDVDAAAQLAGIAQPAVSLDAFVTQVALGEAGETHRIVVGEHHLEPLPAVRRGGLFLAGLNLDQAAATAENPSRLTGCIALDAARLAIGDLKVLVDAAHFKSQRIHGCIRTGSKVDRVAGCGGIQLGARREALIPQAGDENLCEHDPVALFGLGGALVDVAEHVGDGFHLRHGVIELVKRGVERMRVRVGKPRQDSLTVEIDLPGIGAG